MGRKAALNPAKPKVNWILLLIVNYSSKNLTESWQKLRHPAAGIFPSSTCAQPAGGARCDTAAGMQRARESQIPMTFVHANETQKHFFFLLFKYGLAVRI